MRRWGRVWGILALGACLAPAAALPCGDKFLVIGRGGRVPKARHPASIVLYVPPASAFATTARKMHLERTLKQAGHTVQVVGDAAALRERLALRPADFVIADISQAAAIHAPEGAALVPVAGRGVEPGALAGYATVIRAGKSVSYLSALDAAMADRRSVSSR
jgi:hypothetical protein